MDFALRFSLTDREGKEVSSGDAKAVIDEEHLSILPKSGDPYLISLRDIENIVHADYAITLDLPGSLLLSISKLGYTYEDFLRVLYKMRNEIILRDLLMHEKLRLTGVDAQMQLLDSQGKKPRSGAVRFVCTKQRW